MDGERTYFAPLVRGSPGLDEPPDHGAVTAGGRVEEGRLSVHVDGVQAHVVQGVQQEVHDVDAVVPRRAYQEGVVLLEGSGESRGSGSLVRETGNAVEKRRAGRR